jgi:hypothetical protein
MISIRTEAGVEKSSHILKHHGARTDLRDDLKCDGEQVALIFRAKLPPSNRERRTWNTASHEIRVREIPIGERLLPDTKVLFDHVPVRAVRSQRCTSMLVDLYEPDVVETG